MPFFKNRPLLITIIIAVILILLLVFTSGDGMVGGQSVAGGILSKVQVWFYDASNAVGDFFSGLFGGNDVQRENEELRQTVNRLEEETQMMTELEQENERLRELLNYAEENSEFTYVTARVTAKEPGHWFESFTINVGRNQGIAEGMAVVNSDGLIGRVSDVGGSWAKVMTIIDSRSSVSALLEQSRYNGVVQGKTQADVGNAQCDIVNLPYETELLPGDKVLTSGLNDLLPKGLLIGEIEEVPTDSSGTEKTAVVKTAVDFTRLEEVLIITGTEGEEP